MSTKSIQKNDGFIGHKKKSRIDLAIYAALMLCLNDQTCLLGTQHLFSTDKLLVLFHRQQRVVIKEL